MLYEALKERSLPANDNYPRFLLQLLHILWLGQGEHIDGEERDSILRHFI
jgi:hypothetical protein